MKRLVTTSLVICAVLAFTSCKKTTTCTYIDAETGEATTSEVTSNRSLHNAAVKQHSKNGWTCE